MKHRAWDLVGSSDVDGVGANGVAVAPGFVRWRCADCGRVVDFAEAGSGNGEPSSTMAEPPAAIDAYCDPCTSSAVTVPASVLADAIESSTDEAWKARMRLALADVAGVKP